MLYFFHSCPRCKGELQVREDRETGKYLSCLQCGREYNLKPAKAPALARAA